MTLILCGLPMCGKTTIGKRLADTLKWPFIDTDQLIETAYKTKTKKLKSCREIYLDKGELFFREYEKKQIISLKGLEKSVVALGGGSLNDPENVQYLQSLGLLIYLKTEPSLIWERLKENGIPSFLDQNDPENSFYALAEKREAIYEQSAKVIIETGLLSENELVKTLIKETIHG